MTLTVVIPASNAAETLGATLDSLLAQTRRDWQAIVVDDGSTDTTCTIAEHYAGRDARIRLLKDGSGNTGVSGARNRGIAATTTRWLQFLDSDDWIEPAFVEKMMGALEARPDVRIVYCSASNITVDGRVGVPWISSRIANAPFEALARECPLLIHAIVIERTLVVDVGCFDPTLRTGEDGDLWQRVARTGTRFHPVPEAVVYYRARRNSLSTGRRRFADGRTVIARGFERDPRVPHPDPRYADGLNGGDGKEAALAFFALWSAAFDIGEGGTGGGLVQPLPAHATGLLNECHVRIVGALAAGARLLPEDPLPADPAFLATVRGLLQQIETAAGRPGLARLLECALEPEIFRPRQLTERLIVGNALFVRQDIDRLQSIEPLPGVDRLQVEFRKGPRYLGRAETLLFGPMSRRELAALAVEAMSPRVFLKESGVLHRPRFWVSAVAAAARLGRPPLKLRPLARKILIEAAEGANGSRSSATHQRALGDLIRQGFTPDSPASLATQAAPRAMLPILMYHRIADDGPPALARYRTTPPAFAAQLAYLRDNGYHAITSADLSKPLDGRTVLITFDDAYRDFHDTAWPLLRAAGFTAEVMVVTDLVGGRADWDAEHGPAAPLMDWPQIRSLDAEGVRFGSHMASHSHMAALPSRDIVLEAARSRAVLERQLAKPCLSIAPPFGETEAGFRKVVAQCGYRAGFGVEHGWVRPGVDPLHLPRIEVRGDWTIDSFAQALRRPSS